MLLRDIANIVYGDLSDQDAGSFEVTGVRSLDCADSHSITFVVKQKYCEVAEKSQALAVLVAPGWEIPGKVTITVRDPYCAYAIVAQLFEDQSPLFGAGVSSEAVVDSSAVIGEHSSVACGAIVGANVHIGKRCRIDARVVIEKNVTLGDDVYVQSGAILRYGVTLGNAVIIGAGAVIGSDGFANAFTGESFIRIPCFGSVEIEDNVEIGANTTVDRGSFGDTRIAKGARIDNLVMVAHNCEIGESCGIAAQVGFAGSTKIGKRVMIAGQAGFGGHISIGDDSFVGGQAGIQASFPEKSKITGSPAIDLMTRRRIDKAEEQLPTALREIKRLRKELDELKSSNCKEGIN